MIPSHERLKLRIVRDGRTLNGMEKAGHITRMPGQIYVDAEIKQFDYKGYVYIVDFTDGCFYPFVWSVLE